MNKAVPMRLAQITDCHLQADPEARARAGFPLRQLEAVVAAVNRERPTLVLITGDISQDETAASYRLAEQALTRLESPWYWLPGNHDQPALMAECRELHDELDLGTWRALLLDTHVSGQPHGELGEEALNRLAERLAADSRPTLLVMHHPPLPVGSAWLDEIGLADGEAFWRVVAPHRQVRAVLFGHIHQAFHGVQVLADREVSAYGCPSTTDQFLPGSSTFALDAASRPGYRLIELSDGELETWVVRVDP
ncbi:phosphodiesterase [Halomonas daqiaonensis]|uniref:Icc protein n=1 Tax=Halomonas daqiaonensis TaxID=650850 RepID=A0A1H7U2J5_9GAMM|nr:phosphodiesterase [Halomonas daqiaonensis]SEL90477.1 Icc protein [Halomonas daqiaonensis]